ncbi:MAG: acyl-CoA dehydrogenase family protein [Dehalococcoidia bacterium]|nr:acyl-CoA dehydrogenase family protein [Dehalococcoidia bacterium]
MDFTEVAVSKEMEEFRKEVRDWLEANVPEEMKIPIDPEERGEERHHFWRQKGKELGAKGWLNPVFPKQYGGGGLTPEHERIIREEFRRHRSPFRGTEFVYSALLVWATEEQKQKFLVPMLKGEIVAWQKSTEPHSGSDLASYQSTAVRDGDEWVLNGSNVFISGQGRPDLLWGPMETDKQAPRHRNLGFFMIPYPRPGLEISNQNLVNGSEQHFIFLTDVRVPADHLIGGDHQGWQVANTGLEQEHGGQGSIFQRENEVEGLIRYMQQKRRAQQSPGGDLVSQQTAIDVYIENHISNLFNIRTRWMYHSRQEMSWEGPSAFVFDRVSGFRQVARIRDVMGMDSLLGTKESRAYDGGRQEVFQRASFVLQHGAGSFNISKVVLARRIGISRTKERAAPTPMTAGASHNA